MKRLFASLLALVLCISVFTAGCAGKPEPTIQPETTEAAAQAPSTEQETIPAEPVWEPREAPAVRAGMTEEERLESQNAVLAEGALLFSGETNKGWYPNDLSWIQNADPTDLIALVYACDDLTHGGWGVLGMSVASGGNREQLDIPAMADQPDKERLRLYTAQQIADIAGADSPAGVTGFNLGAWNGGRIAGLYLLTGEAVEKMNAHMEKIAMADAIIHTYTGEMSNPNAIPEAKAVYAYLKEVWGEGCLTGQMESTWMGTPDYEMNFIENASGKLPAIRGLDFMHNDFQGVVDRSIEWWEKGGIPHICWHTGSDFASGYDESLGHNLDWDEALTPGTEEYSKLLTAMDRAVPYLQQLEDAGVPVLWRPFHELDGGWFWWSKGGSENFVKLWQLMYDRYTYYWGLDNLIWLLGYSGSGVNMGDWYPGDGYVDLIGADSYTPGANGGLYKKVVEIAAEGMPIVFHECGTIPTEAQMKEDGAYWTMFMVWHTDFITDGKSNTPDSISEIYNGDWFITLDELPDFK